jgi:hypothetical protein
MQRRGGERGEGKVEGEGKGRGMMIEGRGVRGRRADGRLFRRGTAHYFTVCAGVHAEAVARGAGDRVQANTLVSQHGAHYHPHP